MDPRHAVLPIHTAAQLEPVLDAAGRRAQVRAGSLVRVRRGAYADAAALARADADERHRARIHAAAATARGTHVFSHESAAALWRLPSLGPWPNDVHVIVPTASGGRSDPGLRRHALGVDERDVAVVDGLRVTSLARTLVDVASTAGVYWAVAALDAALHESPFGPPAMIDRVSVLEQWESMLPFRGHARARRLITFAETGAGSPRESASRVTIATLGFPPPILQQHFIIDGRDAWSDFYWSDEDAAGECDGESKYRDPRMRGGRSVEDVVIAEKLREDAIRRQVRAFTRWTSAEAFSARALRPKLLELGLRPSRPRLRGSWSSAREL